MNRARLGSVTLLAATCTCTTQARPVVSAWNRTGAPVEVVSVRVSEAPHYGYRLLPGQYGTFGGGLIPRGGGCQRDYDLDPEFRGLLVRDESGRTVWVERTAFQHYAEEGWVLWVDPELLLRTPAVDAGAYLSGPSKIVPGKDEGVWHLWASLHGEGGS
jgi:hypothetical protein